jgi:hypothetical protein
MYSWIQTEIWVIGFPKRQLESVAAGPPGKLSFMMLSVMLEILNNLKVRSNFENLATSYNNTKHL